MAVAVAVAYRPIRALPDMRPTPPATVRLPYRAVELPSAAGPLRLAGAWALQAEDRRFGGLSALAIDRESLLAVTDRGAVARFDFPTIPEPQAHLSDLLHGPGSFGEKWARDAESLVRDPKGRGWWVGYEQNHSLWLYDPGFHRALATIDLERDDWRDNRGAEGLLTEGDHLLVTAENGREAMRVTVGSVERLKLDVGSDVADATLAPDGRAWLLLRSRNLRGISQSIAPLIRTQSGYRAGPRWPVPKGAFDNYEGMAIEPRHGGGWRFWLVSDDGHRLMARTLLAALDYVPTGHDKSPATSAGPSKKPSGKRP